MLFRSSQTSPGYPWVAGTLAGSKAWVRTVQAAGACLTGWCVHPAHDELGASYQELCGKLPAQCCQLALDTVKTGSLNESLWSLAQT